jgi:hypothetical protein
MERMTPEQVRQIHESGRFLTTEECVKALEEQGIVWNRSDVKDGDVKMKEAAYDEEFENDDDDDTEDSTYDDEE